MSYNEIANSLLVTVLVLIGLGVITIFTLIFLKINLSRAKAIGIEKQSVKNVIKATTAFSILPSLSVLIGLFALVPLIGKSWGLFRLSVVGSIVYEVATAQDIASDVDLATASGDVFVLAMFITSGCIIFGLILNLFLAKFYQTKLLSASAKGSSLRNGLIISSVFAGFLFTYVISYFIIAAFNIDNLISGEDFANAVKQVTTMLVYITSLVTTIILNQLIKKIPRLATFSMSISLLVGMCSSVLYVTLLERMF